MIYFHYSWQQWYTASQQFNKKIPALKLITANKQAEIFKILT